MQEEIITYHGNGRFTRQVVTVDQPTEEIDLYNLTEEDAKEDPIFAAIVKRSSLWSL